MGKILGKKFFARPAITVARELIGKYVVRKIGRREIAFMVNETEAYVGPHDLACHASKGRTKRNEPLYGEPGRFYVYFVYGMHYLFNVVTDKKDYPAAVLIRGAGEHDGPGKLARALKVDLRMNAKKAAPETGMWFEDRQDSPFFKGSTRRGRDLDSSKILRRSKIRVTSFKKGGIKKCLKIQRTPRIGVDYAGPVWANKKYRFVLAKKK